MRVIDGFIVIGDDKIEDVTARVPDGLDILDASDMTVTPGLIDAHTHLVHAGSRENEMSMKQNGVSYLEILKNGGGILSTVNKTRAASKDELKAKALKSLDIMLSHGTTTVEAKSGYGLDFETEIKQLEIARELNDCHPVSIVSTYMGAHAIPAEYRENRRGYVDLMINKVMPYTAENGLAEFFDVFCEDGAFTLDETVELFEAAQKLGFGLKLHADEIVPMGGAELAARFAAASAEHLLAASDAGIAVLAEAGVTAVLLPATAFYLMKGHYARAREMIKAGMRVALATDYNPGSCPTENMQAVMTFAAFGMGLTTEEILRGMTLNAAYAINRQKSIGNIKAGMNADLVIFDAPNPDYIIYHFGINHVDMVIKNGKTVFNHKNHKKTQKKDGKLC